MITNNILEKSWILKYIDLIDNDTVSPTNMNRQIIATNKTLNLLKTDAAKQRVLEINPEVEITTHNLFYNSETADNIDLSVYDYVIDAIDTVSAKIELICRCNELNIPIISSMGTGNKLNPNLFEITDIFKTSVCPICRVMRQELKKCNIKSLKVVYSKEEPLKPKNNDFCTETTSNKRQTPGSMPFVPAVAGFIIASEVVKDICQN